MYEFSVLIEPAPDVAGEWIAHCLNWDIVSQGSSWDEARSMLAEALVMVIDEDREAKSDPHDRRRAPDECWARYAHIQDAGQKHRGDGPINELVARGPVLIATTLRLTEVAMPTGAGRPIMPPLDVMPPFMIAAIQNDDYRPAC